MVRACKHSGEGSTDQSREEWAWGGIYDVLLKRDPKQIWKKMLRIVYFGYRYKDVYNIIIFFSVRLKHFTIKH